ncbi:MAG: DUF3365 domain-containing protein [Gammaproteobacteria bacterium]|jgi:hypothetical protein
MLACLLLLAACGSESVTESSSAAVSPRKVAQAEQAAAELGSRLKSRLVDTMAAEGPVAAIRVCSEEAPEIARQVSGDTGLTVSRTSLRVRNPDNAPDARERAVLELWQKRIEDGTPAAALGTFVSDGGDFLWMKPIVAGAPCLMCHGIDIPDAVANAIADRYPQDRATGFAEGDLRGAFVVR